MLPVLRMRDIVDWDSLLLANKNSEPITKFIQTTGVCTRVSLRKPYASHYWRASGGHAGPYRRIFSLRVETKQTLNVSHYTTIAAAQIHPEENNALNHRCIRLQREHSSWAIAPSFSPCNNREQRRRKYRHEHFYMLANSRKIITILRGPEEAEILLISALCAVQFPVFIRWKFGWTTFRYSRGSPFPEATVSSGR